MDIMTKIYQMAEKDPQRVVFPEAANETILRAVREARDRNVCIPILVGDKKIICETAESIPISLDGISIVDSTDESFLMPLIDQYCRTHLNNSIKTMKRKSKDSMYAALMMLAVGQADCMFAGIDHTTGDVLMGGYMVLGLAEGVSAASSISIYDIPGYEGEEGSLLAYGDTAVCAEPDAEALAGIAISSCETVKSLFGWEPRCALLSYSTLGSGEGRSVDKVVEAVEIANRKRPDLMIEGEFQLDAAINREVAKKKIPEGSKVAGKANIVIVPDLNAGNIGSKILQRITNANIYGPLLQGFSRIICDCSRGARVEDIIGNVAMSCVRAQKSK